MIILLCELYHRHFTNLYKIWYTKVMIERMEHLSHHFTAAALAGVAFLGASAVGAEFAPRAEAITAAPDGTTLDETPTVLETPAYAYEANQIAAAKPNSATSYKIPNFTPNMRLLAAQILSLQTATLADGTKPHVVEGLRAKGKQFMSGGKFKTPHGLTVLITENSLGKHDPTKVVAVDEYVSDHGTELIERHFVKLASGRWNATTKANVPSRGLVPAIWEHRQAVSKTYDIMTGKAKMSTDLKTVNKSLAAQIGITLLDASPKLSGSGVITTG
jgi:hypothetical protein